MPKIAPRATTMTARLIKIKRDLSFIQDCLSLSILEKQVTFESKFSVSVQIHQ